MANQKTREKRRAMRERKALRKQGAEVIVENDDEVELPIEQPVDDEPLEKSYEDEYGYPRATSWEDVDAMREAEEKAIQVNHMSWTARDLVFNIVRSEMDPDEKAKAISEVGNGFATRIKNVSGDHMKKSTSEDMALLEIRALIAKDKRHTPAMEKIKDWVSKARMTSSAESTLSDNDFALVVERDGNKVRKYPIHDKAYIRKSMERAAQMLEEGGDAADDARAALVKIREAARSVGIGKIDKDANSVIVEKDNSGQWRAVMYPSNNFKDTDGEILAEEAHIEYVDWVNKNMDLAPVFVTWHMPETIRKNRVDFVDYTDGYLLMSAPLEEHEAAGLLRVQALCDVGMSHGTFALERSADNPKIITKYRMVEVSDLPLSKAANPFTDFSVISKEADMDRMQYLTNLLGETEAKKYYEKAGLKQEALRKSGVEEKEAKPASEASEPPATPEPTPGTDLEAIFKAVEERLDIPGLNAFVLEAKEAMEKVVILEEVVKERSTSHDDTLAKMISPPIMQKMAWTRPSTSKDNVADEKNEVDKTLIKSKPKFWLDEVTGVEAIEQEVR